MGIKFENVDDDTPPRIRINLDNDDELVVNGSDQD